MIPASRDDLRREIERLDALVTRALAAVSGFLTSSPPTNIEPDDPNLVGVAPTAARADHQHGIVTETAVTISDAANAEGVAASFSRADHLHAHGARAGGALHALVTTLVAGFMSAADKTKLDGIAARAQIAVILWGNDNVAATPTTRFLTAGFDDVVAPILVVQFRVPGAGVFRNMRVHVRAGAGNGNLIVYTLRVNSVVTLLAVSMASTALDGSNLVNTAAVVAGDLIDIQVTKALAIGASPSDIMCSVEFGAS